METAPSNGSLSLREVLADSGHRYTEQRAAVYRFLAGTTSHPTADEVFQDVRRTVPAISLATVYKSLETLVGCGLAIKLSYSDGSARYDARTEPHHHARCSGCGRVLDVSGELSDALLADLTAGLDDFVVTGYRLELTGYCSDCGTAERDG
jgi:Fe2+ or Zn2+ uptake regulation protein